MITNRSIIALHVLSAIIFAAVETIPIDSTMNVCCNPSISAFDYNNDDKIDVMVSGVFWEQDDPVDYFITKLYTRP